jgi:hypothetical protein
MLRLVLSAVVLAGVLATGQPTFADPVAATAPEHAHATAAATEQPATAAPASWSSSSDVPAPASAGSHKDTAPAGFGWG